ncbi:hypothetical protein C943_00712 [Mariniradius saccharolyticus AK6]|uniref:Uncharacterized protein n=1 Tax=Mariniradius saccharolyticus AK6 TaxID=1239962 RepID=M7XW41_9BACT|nr:hypothetical protein C943_00712 [Mariniradius saccharolyticus AK6]
MTEGMSRRIAINPITMSLNVIANFDRKAKGEAFVVSIFIEVKVLCDSK